MKIINKKTLATMPNGTLYCCFTPDCFQGELCVITGHHGLEDDYGIKWDNEGFNSILPLEPFVEDEETKHGENRITNWSTVDTHDFDYNDNQLFAVFSKTEIRAMITVLQYALSDCNFPINKFMDTYYLGDIEIDKNDLNKYK